VEVGHSTISVDPDSIVITNEDGVDVTDEFHIITYPGILTVRPN